MSLFSRAKQFVVKEHNIEKEKSYSFYKAFSPFIFFSPLIAFDRFINDPQCERSCSPCYFKCIEGVYDGELGFNYTVTQLSTKDDPYILGPNSNSLYISGSYHSVCSQLDLKVF